MTLNDFIEKWHNLLAVIANWVNIDVTEAAIKTINSYKNVEVECTDEIINDAKSVEL